MLLLIRINITDDGCHCLREAMDIFLTKRCFMLSISYKQNPDIIEALNYEPCVSILMPFDPKMEKKSVIETRLKCAINKIKQEVRQIYSPEKAEPVLQKLGSLIEDLNYMTHKRSIAVFVSPLTAKVYYLNIPVKEKIIVDHSFDIRTIIYNKKEIAKYLVLVVTTKRSNIFLGAPAEFARIVSNTADHAAVINNMPEPVANFSDVSKRVLSDKFLRQTDNGLSMILKSYPFPLFVMGTDEVIGQFKKVAHNNNSVLNYIHGDFEEASEAEIRKVILPYVADWEKVKQQSLLSQLNIARESGKLAIGIENVLSSSILHKGRLLVVEKNFIYRRDYEPGRNICSSNYLTGKRPFYIKDAVGEVIENVFENGGEVEFVDESILKDFGHIALITNNSICYKR
jgi:hypothetical protein